MEQIGVTGDPAKLAQERTAIRDALKTVRFSGMAEATPSTRHRWRSHLRLRDRDQRLEMEYFLTHGRRTRVRKAPRTMSGRRICVLGGCGGIGGAASSGRAWRMVTT